MKNNNKLPIMLEIDITPEDVNDMQTKEIILTTVNAHNIKVAIGLDNIVEAVKNIKKLYEEDPLQPISSAMEEILTLERLKPTKIRSYKDMFKQANPHSS